MRRSIIEEDGVQQTGIPLHEEEHQSEKALHLEPTCMEKSQCIPINREHIIFSRVAEI